jgi:hypothetical protein
VGRGGVGEFQPGSGSAGETTKRTSGARMAVIEGEGVATGLRKLEEEACAACGRRGRRGGWLG